MPSVSVHQNVKGFILRQFLIIVLTYNVSIAYPVLPNELSDLVSLLACGPKGPLFRGYQGEICFCTVCALACVPVTLANSHYG